ncbi:MAG TPA: ABC transporter permease [Candidatus Acidoferrales bacterium]|nr:ABC transporter permease [Candidatus Acidoferrales bacterium]
MASFRIVLRGLLRTPLFTAIAIVSLALGIGANTAIFSLLDQLLLRTLPVQNPRELAYLYHVGPVQGSSSSDEGSGSPFSYPAFREMQKEQTAFAGLAGARNEQASLAYKNSASHGTARMVSGNYFGLLGVRPAIGRLFTEEDDRTPGGHPLAILGYSYWVSSFGADPAVLNQTIGVNGYPMTIVGVAQKGFGAEKLGTPPEVYLPICMRKEIVPDLRANTLSDRRSYWVTLFGRMKPGQTLQQAETAINVTYRGQLQQDVELLRQPKPDFLARFKAKKVILKEGQYGRGGLRDETRRPMLLLMGITALVLLIACANVANLLLARGAARTREVAVRLAMGASRGQLIRQLLTESCVLAVAGGALGLLGAWWTVRGLLAAVPPSRGLNGYLSSSLDGRVMLFSLALSVATGIVFGLFPALQATKADLVSSLKSQVGQASPTASANRFRKSLVTAQMAISLLLLISAGLFGKTLLNLSSVNLGIRTDHLVTFSLLPKLNKYTDQAVAAFHEQLTDRLAAIPGVTLVSSAQVPVIANSTSSQSITIEGYTPPSDDGAGSDYNLIGAGFFRTIGIPLLGGREFTRRDNAAAPKVAIVNEAFVRQFFARQNPLGRHLARGSPKTTSPDLEIVGVVKDARYADMKQPPPPVFYTPLQQAERWNYVVFYLRTALDPEHVAPQVRRAVASLDPNLPIRQLKTMEAQIEENMFAERMLSSLTTAFAGLATLLAAVGLYGVLAFNVARRTREIGIRMALGAGATQVRSLVVREVALMLVIGTMAGVAAAAAAGKFVQSFLFGMKPLDAAVYGLAAGLLWLIAMGAAYLPVRRATSVDPMVALRYE